MNAVLDTNILISGLFFGGPPRAVLDAWVEGRYQLLLTSSIIDEYTRTCERLAKSHPGLEYQPILATVIGHGALLADTASNEPITADPDDDKFMLCARSGGAVVVSGDHHLLAASGWAGVTVMRPREFLTLLDDQ